MVGPCHNAKRRITLNKDRIETKDSSANVFMSMKRGPGDEGINTYRRYIVPTHKVEVVSFSLM